MSEVGIHREVQSSETTLVVDRPSGRRRSDRLVGAGRATQEVVDQAMAVANDETVLGDFDDVVFDDGNVTARFFKRDGIFLVETRGPGGQPGEFEVAYTFGVEPLQQYLIPFPGGRFQALAIAWDTRRHEWFNRYPGQAIGPDDWLHWTRNGQNWNGMCAECHSTNLVKGYDARNRTFSTTWSEIDVGCEACHGPGSRHVAWAELPPMARPVSDNYELIIRTGGVSSRHQVELRGGGTGEDTIQGISARAGSPA